MPALMASTLLGDRVAAAGHAGTVVVVAAPSSWRCRSWWCWSWWW
jgi:hypothetical protein